MSVVTEEIRAKAEIYHGQQVCEEQVQRLLKDMGLPNGLLPLADPEECGYVPETGFVWLKQKKKSEHKFEKINKLVSYACEVTGYVEECKIKKITGVKAKELMIWITISEISIPKANAEKITFKSAAGPSRTFPAEAFVAREAANVDVVKDGAKAEVKDIKEANGGLGLGLAAAEATATTDVKKEANNSLAAAATTAATTAAAKEVKKEVNNGLAVAAVATSTTVKEV